jgi:hypothetical protein
MDEQTDRQTDRQTDIQTFRKTDRYIERFMDFAKVIYVNRFYRGNFSEFVT